MSVFSLFCLKRLAGMNISTSKSSTSSSSSDSGDTDPVPYFFQEWCQTNNYDAEAYISVYDFLRSLNLCVFPDDPLEYPGLQHAVSLITSDRLSFKDLSMRDQGKIISCLDKTYSDQHIVCFFDVSQTIGHCWLISATISDAEGFFNRGVHMVQDMDHSNKTPCVIKILPSEAMYTGYAQRDIDIMYRLRDHSNIVQIQDGHVPHDRHGTPWVVMDFCNACTLKSCIKKNLTKYTCVPELFVWHVFESLVEAVRFCHYGPVETQAVWDPISHRDIIPGNILLHQDDSSGDSYPVVKLANFGCAVTDSEVCAKGFAADDLPEEDPGAVPPEGAVATEAADIYQIGLVIEELSQNDLWHGGPRSAKLMCTSELRYFVDVCISEDPVDRPRVAVLLEVLQRRKAGSLADGAFAYKKLIL